MQDLISRQMATDALRKMQTYKLFSGDDMLLIDQAGAMTELMLLPPAQPEQLGTNLAEVGTGCISRQAAIDAFNTNIDELVVAGKENADAVERYLNRVIDEIKQLPPIQPEIIHCKDCRKHNKKLGFDENYNLTYKDDACPLIPWRGMSKGHEHDYQSCSFGEKREVTT